MPTFKPLEGVAAHMTYDIDPVARTEARLWRALLEVDEEHFPPGTGEVSAAIRSRLRQLDLETGQQPPGSDLPAGQGLASYDMVRMLSVVFGAGPEYDLPLNIDSTLAPNAHQVASESLTVALGKVADVLETWREG